MQGITKAIMTASLALCAGCSSTKPVDWNRVADGYYTQGGPNSKRTYEIFHLSGCTKICMEGSNIVLKMEHDLPQLSILPKEPGTVESIAKYGSEALKFGVGALAAASVAKPTVVMQPAPTVVMQPEPLVVMPEGGGGE